MKRVKSRKKEVNFLNAHSRSILSIYSLINKYFWKNKLGPIIVFIFPLFLVVFLFIVSLNSDNKYIIFAQENIFIISISAIPISLFTMPLLLVEIKKSILLKKIAQAQIRRFTYTLIIATYFGFLSAISVMLTEIYWLCFMNVHISEFFNIQDGGYVFYSLFCLILVSTSLGMLIGCLLKNTSAIPILGIAILLVTFVISGILDPTTVASVNALKYINLLSPLNYPLILVNETFFVYSASTHNIFDLSTSYEIINFHIIIPQPKNFWEFLTDYLAQKNIRTIIWYYQWQKALGLFFPFLIFIFFNLLSIKFFSWSSR